LVLTAAVVFLLDNWRNFVVLIEDFYNVSVPLSSRQNRRKTVEKVIKGKMASLTSTRKYLWTVVHLMIGSWTISLDKQKKCPQMLTTLKKSLIYLTTEMIIQMHFMLILKTANLALLIGKQMLQKLKLLCLEVVRCKMTKQGSGPLLWMIAHQLVHRTQFPQLS
jgi:hypothetical protein